MSAINSAVVHVVGVLARVWPLDEGVSAGLREDEFVDEELVAAEPDFERTHVVMPCLDQDHRGVICHYWNAIRDLINCFV